jgi:Salmonella virulence plasmid 65kDa B protein
MLKPATTKSGLRVHRWVACALLLTLFACGGGGDTRREELVAQVAQADVNPDPSVPPAMPQALTLPTSPIVPGADVGYLPAAWSVSPSGQFTYSIPLDVPQGRAGMQPKLSLNYSSDAGNGLLGIGWSVSGLSSITRCGKSLSSEGTVDGVDYSDFTTDQEESVDHFCLDGQKLVAISGRYGAYGTEYRTEHDIYAQIFSEGSIPTAKLGPTSFTVRNHDGQLRVYQSVSSPRWRACTHEEPCAGGMVSEDKAPGRWLLASETDRSGNRVVYTYTTDDDGSGGQEILPSKIDYTKHTSDSSSYRYVQLNYENRQDTNFSWQSGVRVSQSKRLKSIVMHAPNPATTMPVWMYRFQYTTDANKGPAIADPSLLASVQKCGISKDTPRNPRRQALSMLDVVSRTDLSVGTIRASALPT